MTIPAVPIRDIAVPKGLIGGPFGSSLGATDYVSSGIPVIRGANLASREVCGEFVFVTQQKVDEELARNTAAPGDLVFTQRGTLGQVAMVPFGDYGQYVVSQSQMRLRVDVTKVDPSFVYYACRSAHFLRQVADNAITTGVPHINLGILGRLVIPLPTLPVQSAVAEILSALDDKIASNIRLSQVSVELADAEFVRAMRRGSVKGDAFGTVADVGGGGTPSTTNPALWGGGLLWATPTDVTALEAPYLTSTLRTLTDEGLSSCASSLYPAGSILMTSRATIGAFAIAEVPTAVNQGFIVVNARNAALQWWLFHQMRARVPEFLSYANGATFLELSRGQFKKLATWTAEGSVTTEFAGLAACLHNRSSAAMRESDRLTCLRGALLPELVSGRLMVKAAQRIVEGEI